MNTLEIAKQAAKILDDKKAHKISLLKIRDLTVMADYLVIAHGTSSTHVKSLADDLEFLLKEQGIAPLRKEGFNTKNWFIIDYGNVIAHVFSEQAREFYDLEHLWADGENIPLDFDE